ncbi:MAG: ImmA/IrrE family metallo-endopeptidase [Thaumarchaeota archaeon]|nr:ImmA/IrrE family metallo-endopeptidase [Nitrososphaerota archaeon]
MLKNLDVNFGNQILEQKAAELLRCFARQRQWSPSLPVPVDSIIEHTLDLCIDYDTLEESPGTLVWGCIQPARKTITLNESHVQTFQDCPGLERFTLGHEVGHWVMHVDHDALSQASLFGSSPESIVCRDGDDSVKEQVANRFSAFLLMPKDLMAIELPKHDVTSRTGFRQFAEQIQVSYSALGFRLKKLGVNHYE